MKQLDEVFMHNAHARTHVCRHTQYGMVMDSFKTFFSAYRMNIAPSLMRADGVVVELDRLYKSALFAVVCIKALIKVNVCAFLRVCGSPLCVSCACAHRPF